MDMKPPVGKTYIKTLIREIRQSMGRFLAIFAIVALGVGFLAGILQATPDMRISMDSFYRKNHMADIFIKSTMGLTEDDLKEVSSLEGIKNVMPAYVTDVIMDTSEDESLVTRVYGLPLSDLNGDTFVNSLTLVEGRLPEKPGECLSQEGMGSISTLSLGTTLTISKENHDYKDMGSTYSVMEYTVVGIVENPFYISVESEPSTVGNGRVGAIIYADEASYNLDVYTDFYITLSGTDGLVSFTSDYEDYVNSFVDKLDSISKDRCSIRYSEIVSDAEEKLEEGRESYADAKEEAEEKLSSAWNKLISAQKEIQEGEKKLSSAKQQLKEGREELKKQRSLYEAEINKARVSLEEKRKELEESKSLLENSKAQLDASKDSIEGARSLLQARASLPSDIEEKIEDYDAAVEEYNNMLSQLEKYPGNAALELKLQSIKKQLDESRPFIEQARSIIQACSALPSDIESQIRQYDEGVAAYEDGMQQILEGEKQLADVQKQLEQSMAEAESRFQSAEKKLDDAEKEILSKEAELSSSKDELEKGFKEYYESKSEAEEELQKAAEEIASGEKELAEIEYPQWYVLDRNFNVSYASYKINIKKVEEIAKVFPIFFLMVAAMVALTTMTRMIEEERIQIGTLKALGYSKSAIISKYMVYCGLSSLLGSAFGLLVGFQVLPRVIYTAYSTMYTLPPIKALFSWGFALISCLLSVSVTLGATYLACRHTLKEKPARLMLPMAPKAGKRILLERIKFIWSKLSFNYKSTARNIFRYKKHFIMTITGIAGCTALILTGFGLKDSLNCISDAQYDQLFKYDLTITLKEGASLEDVVERLEANSTHIDSYTGLCIETANVETKDGSVAINLFCSDKDTSFSNLITLRDRKTQKAIPFTNSSVILTEKLAEILGVSAGDTVKVQYKDGTWTKLTITGVTENYVGSYLYMGYDAYKDSFGNTPPNNSIIASTGLDTQEKRDEAAEIILSDDDVSGISFVSQTRGSFENLLSSVNYIVAVIIVAAGALAVIVLYNLTNININERKKELATLKVLGFHDWEVAAYIYREIILLTLIGTLLGLGLGVLLHMFVISRAESTDLMFGRSINASSFLFSAGFTLLFSLLVDVIMYKKLMDIEMVDSMKAVD